MVVLVTRGCRLLKVGQYRFTSAAEQSLIPTAVKANYITYYKTTVGMAGFLKETTLAPLTGQVADTGILREMGKDDIEKARAMA